MSRRPVLSDHRKQGKRLIPPMVDALGPMEAVSWFDTMVPEFIWLALVLQTHGYKEGIDLVTTVTRMARQAVDVECKRTFATVSDFSTLDPPQVEAFQAALKLCHAVEALQEALSPLVQLYPACPLAAVLPEWPGSPAEDALAAMRSAMSEMRFRTERFPMMVQATAVWTALDSGKLQGGPADFLEIEHYPDTEESRRVGAGIRSTVNMGVAEAVGLFVTCPTWYWYFWNMGLELSGCEVHDGL